MAEMEAKIAQLVSEQQQLINDVQTLQAQNQQLKQQVEQKVRLVVLPTVKQESSDRQIKVEDAEQDGKEVRGAEHVSLDHVSNPQPLTRPAGTDGLWVDSGVDCGVDVGGDVAVDVGLVSDVFYESAVLASPQWKTSHTKLTSHRNLRYNTRTSSIHPMSTTTPTLIWMLLTLSTLASSLTFPLPRPTSVSWRTATSSASHNNSKKRTTDGSTHLSHNCRTDAEYTVSSYSHATHCTLLPCR